MDPAVTEIADATTKVLRSHMMPTLSEWYECQDLPIETCNKYRIRHGLQPIDKKSTTEKIPVQNIPLAEKPTLLQKAVTFAKAATKHVAAGMPQSPPEVIEARLAICQGCEKLQNNHCSVCGCACNSSTFMNKLAWARESCPHPDGPKWGPHEQSI